MESNVKFWYEKIELIYGEEALCHQFINVKGVSKTS